MTWKWIIILALVLLLLQCIIFPSVRPDLLMLLVVNISLFDSRERAAISGFLIGIVQDSFSSVPLGAFALAKSIGAFLIHAIASPLIPENRIVHVMGIAIGLAVQNIILFVIMVSMSDREFAMSGMYSILGREALYTVIAYPFAFAVMTKIRARKKVRHAEDEWF